MAIWHENPLSHEPVQKVWTFKGKRAEDMTREELVAAFTWAAQTIDEFGRRLENHDEIVSRLRRLHASVLSW